LRLRNDASNELFENDMPQCIIKVNQATTTANSDCSRQSHNQKFRIMPSDDRPANKTAAWNASNPIEQPLNEQPFQHVLQKARLGDARAIGSLCELSRKYLLLIANQDLNAAMLQKFGASDVVQQSMIVANQKIGQFHGTTQGEFLAWMRQILINECRQTSRLFQGTEKRSISREQSLQLGPNSEAGDRPLNDPQTTPSTQAINEEQIQLVQRAMGSMSEAERQVIEMRNWQEMSFEDIGKSIGKSPEAARKFWSRSILKLEQELTRLNAI